MTARRRGRKKEGGKMPFPITEEDFFSACRSVHGGDGGGIGTLSEKTVHAVLKH